MKSVSKLSVDTEDSFSSLLEFAANNDVESFKRSLELDLSAVDESGLWYVRKEGTKQITQEERTPLMVASTYDSVDVLKLIVALPEVDLNKTCGPNKWTALHCAASGGSINAFNVVKLLLSAGADPNVKDELGRRPIDVILAPPKLSGARAVLEELLASNVSIDECNLNVSLSNSDASSPDFPSPHSSNDCVSSPTAPKSGDVVGNSVSEKKQYPVDPSLPDIRNSIYSTDEFRMFSFKIRPCSRAYSHDWTECPFVHPGENARRRDPRKFHYSCVPCPDFRKGACRRGDMCEYAHGVFECWLHPAQYRTRLCKDGTSCNRQVCFFAHTQEELRPLYVSTGSGVPSPRSASSGGGFMDMASALSLFPCSPTSQGGLMSPAFNQNMSPTAPNGMSHSSSSSSSSGWPQANVPALSLPSSNLQSSRLRSSLNARDILPDDINMLQEFDSNHMVLNSPMLNLSARSKSALAPSNLEELFSAEIIAASSSSPRFSDHTAGSGVFSPTHKSAVRTMFQQQQTMLSPINTSVYSPRNIESPLLAASFNVSSPRMSPRNLEIGSSPMSAARMSAIAHREKHLQHMRSLSSRDLGSEHVTSDWANWGSPTGKADWSIGGDDQNRLKTWELSKNKVNDSGDEPHLSWVQSLVKESSSPPEMIEKHVAPASSSSGSATSGECLKQNPTTDSIDHTVLGAWLEQMQLDQLVV